LPQAVDAVADLPLRLLGIVHRALKHTGMDRAISDEVTRVAEQNLSKNRATPSSVPDELTQVRGLHLQGAAEVAHGLRQVLQRVAGTADRVAEMLEGQARGALILGGAEPGLGQAGDGAQGAQRRDERVGAARQRVELLAGGPGQLRGAPRRPLSLESLAG